MNVVVVVQRPEPTVVGLMVMHVVVLHDHVTETEALEQVLEALERDPAALSAAILIEQSTQRLPRRRVLPQNAGQLAACRRVRQRRRRQRQQQHSKHTHYAVHDQLSD